MSVSDDNARRDFALLSFSVLFVKYNFGNNTEGVLFYTTLISLKFELSSFRANKRDANCKSYF